jgi:hypothetical protein
VNISIKKWNVSFKSVLEIWEDFLVNCFFENIDKVFNLKHSEFFKHVVKGMKLKINITELLLKVSKETAYRFYRKYFGLVRRSKLRNHVIAVKKGSGAKTWCELKLIRDENRA